MTPVDLDAAAAVLLSWLLTYAVHSSILLAAAALAAWWFADRHAWLDLIWKTALVAPLLTASLHLDPIALPLGPRWPIPSVTPVSGGPTPPHALLRERVETSTRSVEAGTPPTASERPAASDQVAATAEPRFTLTVPSWRSLAALAWLMIAIVTVAGFGIRLRRVYRALGSGVPATDLLDTIDDLRKLAQEHEPIRLTVSPHCPVPLALAHRHMVLPERFFDELDREQQRAALAHELAHVVRRDPEWRIAVEILERVMFFQPLIRLARVRLCDSAEFVCDEWAVRQTQSPLALARCLSVVASWWSAADELPSGVSAMARSDSAMIRRVTNILNGPVRPPRRPQLFWLAIPVMLVAVAAPRVTGTGPAATVTPAIAAILNSSSAVAAAAQRTAREQTAADSAKARAQLRLHRSSRPNASLEERWRDALADARRQNLNEYWIVYTFNTPTHADGVMIGDTREGSVVWSRGHVTSQGPALTELFNPSAVPLEGGNLAVLLHYRGAGAIDRAGYRSVHIGFDFGRTPVFFVGDAPESQSFEKVRGLFGEARDQKIQVLLIELASLHSNTAVVAPFLERLLASSWPPLIREEAAEGFGHHHDPRSVEILLRVARTDPDSSVRAEAAETIGEVQTSQSIPALTDLVAQSTDPDVRREAAEAFAEQPADRAIPAIEQVLSTTTNEDVLGEAVEALGELGGQAALDALTRLVWEHQDVTIQREAVETLGDLDDAAAIPALERVAREHTREEVQIEAIETLADRSEGSLHPLILELAASGRSAKIRSEALDTIGSAIEKIADAPSLDRAQQAIERAVFDDPDRGVQLEALDTLDELPADRATRVLRDVIARHPDARLRREAEEQLRERRQ